MALITYDNKTTGDTFTAADANEIKTVVNTNAFNAANTATGTTSVTINATSGVATFTSVIPIGTTVIFEVSNSLITTDSIIQYSLKYITINGATPVVCFYSIPFNGLIRFRVVNFGDLSTNSNMSISFQILG